MTRDRGLIASRVARDFSLLHNIQTHCGALPVSYAVLWGMKVNTTMPPPHIMNSLPIGPQKKQNKRDLLMILYECVTVTDLLCHRGIEYFPLFEMH